MKWGSHLKQIAGKSIFGHVDRVVWGIKWGSHLYFIAGTHPLLPQHAQSLCTVYINTLILPCGTNNIEVVSCVHRPLVNVIRQLSVDIVRPLPILLVSLIVLTESIMINAPTASAWALVGGLFLVL